MDVARAMMIFVALVFILPLVRITEPFASMITISEAVILYLGTRTRHSMRTLRITQLVGPSALSWKPWRQLFLLIHAQTGPSLSVRLIGTRRVARIFSVDHRAPSKTPWPAISPFMAGSGNYSTPRASFLLVREHRSDDIHSVVCEFVARDS
jgi:hypothetical protein